MSPQLDNVQFHSDNGYNSHPAVNVKYRGSYGYAHNCPDDVPEKDWDRICEAAWEECCESFWDNAQDIAKERGYDGVFSEGRSGGWMVPYYQSRSGRTYQGQNFRDGDRWAGPVRYPDFDRDGRDDYGSYNLGEISRFLAFQRRIEAMLAVVDEELKYFTDCQLDSWRYDRDAKEAKHNSVEPDLDTFTTTPNADGSFDYEWESAS